MLPCVSCPSCGHPAAEPVPGLPLTRLKLLPLLVALAAFTGCTSTRTLDRADLAAVRDAHQHLRGRTVAVELVSGAHERGRLDFVRVDSTAWRRDGERRAVPTSEVAALVSDIRVRSALRGLAVGAGVGLAVTGLALLSEPADPYAALGELVLEYLAVPTGVIYGTGIGAALGRRRVYCFGE